MTEYLIQEANPKTLTNEQEERLRVLDNWIDEIVLTLEEGKEFGLWGAYWRHLDRVEHPNVKRYERKSI